MTNASILKSSRGKYIYNRGIEGAIAIAIYNENERAIKFIDCTIELNHSQKSLMNLISSQVYFENSLIRDNAADRYTHGLTMISSTAELFQTTVTFSEEFGPQLDVENVETGFFKLLLNSKLVLSDNTVISNLRATNQAFISAMSLSSIYIHDNVKLINN